MFLQIVYQYGSVSDVAKHQDAPFNPGDGAFSEENAE